MTRTWRIDLPWNSPPLRDNDRKHWAVKARDVAMLRRDIVLIARSDRIPRGLEKALIELHWQPAVRRHRDQFSITPTLKPLVDGLVDYGLAADDDVGHVALTCVIEPVRKPSCMWLRIVDLSEARTG